ncbi:MAG: Gfo/Idh/MocA family oxidoreductase [Candidatus Cloacimonetes bacterium]|jgi:predicted dehydrogenase|nr:Gfo/Idh/MocA family oxidoreductase [Candidatus Cloacimonadota bacterium]
MLKIGIAGVGRLGRFHAGKFLADPRCELAGVYDINERRSAEAARDFGVKDFRGYDELIAACDAVDIAATTSAHHELAKAALLAGKPVFVEKPLCAELAQAEELVALAEERGLKIQVGHIERFNPVILEAEQYIREPLFIESTRISSFQPRGTDVSVVLDLMIHDIDLILDFVQSPLDAVHANGAGILTPSLDIANARLEFASGAVANVTSSRVGLKQERRIRFFQRDAYISLDLVNHRGSLIRQSARAGELLQRMLRGETGIEPEELIDARSLEPGSSGKDALALELEAWVEAILEDKKPVVDGQAGLRALRAAARIGAAISRQNLFTNGSKKA